MSGATERWKGQVEDLKKYSSYPDAVGLDGEPIEFEWTNFPGFSSFFFFARSRTTWTQRTSSQKTSRTGSSSCPCSMTLYGKKIDENCISNAEEVRNYAMKFFPGHWTFLGPGSEEKGCGDFHDRKGQWNRTANKMVQRFKETDHPVFKSTSAVSRGILKQRRGQFTLTMSSVSTEQLRIGVINSA